MHSQNIFVSFVVLSLGTSEFISATPLPNSEIVQPVLKAAEANPDIKAMTAGLQASLIPLVQVLVRDGSSPSHRKLAEHILKLIKARDAASIHQLAKDVNDAIVYRQRMAKCIESLGSRAICSRNVAFYVWAQELAGKIMDGETSKL